MIYLEHERKIELLNLLKQKFDELGEYSSKTTLEDIHFLFNAHFYLKENCGELEGILKDPTKLEQFKQAFRDFANLKVNTGNPYESLVSELYANKTYTLALLNSGFEATRQELRAAIRPQIEDGNTDTYYAMINILIEDALVECYESNVTSNPLQPKPVTALQVLDHIIKKFRNLPVNDPSIKHLKISVNQKYESLLSKISDYDNEISKCEVALKDSSNDNNTEDYRNLKAGAERRRNELLQYSKLNFRPSAYFTMFSKYELAKQNLGTLISEENTTKSGGARKKPNASPSGFGMFSKVIETVTSVSRMLSMY